jgi:hypothetical protein
MKRLLAVALFAPLAFAQAVTDTSRGVVYAHEGRVQLAGGWSVTGVETATSIVAGKEHVAVLDAIHNDAVIIELATGRATQHATEETPVDASFLGAELYILARDARVLQHVGAGSIPLAADPAFLRAWQNTLYVYSRTAGVLQEIANDRVVRTMSVAPFASDMEIADGIAYLAYPREGRIRAVELKTMEIADNVTVGAVPTDLAFAGGGTAITARILAVADPSAKRVWLTEGTQSTAEAVARGFLRGFLGLGLFGKRASQFPAGVDRVLTRDKLWVAYDTSTRTLYRFTKTKSSVIARDIAPNAFTLTARGVVVFKNGGISVAVGNSDE